MNFFFSIFCFVLCEFCSLRKQEKKSSRRRASNWWKGQANFAWLFRIFSVSFLRFQWIFVGKLQRVSQELPWGPEAFLRPSSTSLTLPHKGHFLVKFWGKQRSVMQGYPGQNNGFFPEAIWRFFWTRMSIISRSIEFYPEAIRRVDINLWQEFPETIQQSSCQNSEEFMRKIRGRPTKRVLASSHTDTFWVYSVSFLVKLFKSLRISLGQFGSLVRATYQSRSVEFWDCTETIGSGTLLELLND